ncbi:796_t:CDS:2 [Scutellospora calospora]|uniref:796_t:CDS:1 n=1 Tax=Scutellospora calospora TaxID=85575 RepID=A0ACA9JYG5_9GLOM|nr:796_t:CDS:2 [Scutellospora calospora]
MSNKYSKKKSQSSKNNITTEINQIDIDDVVNNNTLNAHLSLMTKFKALEHKNNDIDKIFLLHAKKRYILWLELLNNTYKIWNENNQKHVDKYSKKIWEENTKEP